jgi:hypothetical protein
MKETPDDLRSAISKSNIFSVNFCDDARLTCILFEENVLATVAESSSSAEKKINAIEALSECLKSKMLE